MKRSSGVLLAVLTAAAACAPLEGAPRPELEECWDPFSGTIEAPPSSAPPGNVAPAGALPGERPASQNPGPLAVGADPDWGPPVRIDAEAGEHVGVRLAFEDERAEVDLELLLWDRGRVRRLGVTNWGRDFSGTGFRVLAAFDADGPRTFWARARSSTGLSEAQISVTRTWLEDGPVCHDDCERLLQLPLPIDPTRQGYALSSESVYAYQFGRRDLIMALLHAGRRVVAAGLHPFEVKRLSRWDGGTPPSHRSHAGGVDVDLSLYDAAGLPVWQALCANDGRRCIGRPWGLDGRAMALLVASFFESERFEPHGPAVILIDRLYHREIRAGADRLVEEGLISPEIHALFGSSTGLLRHVEPHHHHVHVRIAESPVGQEGD